MGKHATGGRGEAGVGDVRRAVAQAMRYAGCHNRRSLSISDVFPPIPDHGEKSRMAGARTGTTRAAALLGHLQPQPLLIARQVRQATPSSETLGDGVALAALAVLVGAVDASSRGRRIVVGIN